MSNGDEEGTRTALVVRVLSEILYFRNFRAFTPGGYRAGSCNETNKITRVLARREILNSQRDSVPKVPKRTPVSFVRLPATREEISSRTLGAAKEGGPHGRQRLLNSLMWNISALN